MFRYRSVNLRDLHESNTLITSQAYCTCLVYMFTFFVIRGHSFSTYASKGGLGGSVPCVRQCNVVILTS